MTSTVVFTLSVTYNPIILSTPQNRTFVFFLEKVVQNNKTHLLSFSEHLIYIMKL